MSPWSWMHVFVSSAFQCMKRKSVYVEEEREALKQAGGEGIPWKVDGDGDTWVTPPWTGSAGAVQY